MKRILLSAIAIVALGTTAAQAQEIGIGAKAGVNFANFGGDIEDASGRTGFHVGVVGTFKLSETFAIQPEIVFSQQGSQTEQVNMFMEDGVAMTQNREDKQTLNYINVPIVAKYYITEGLSLHAGPQVGFLISAKSKFDTTNTATAGGSSISTSASGEEDNKEGFETIDFGVVAGIGYELPMGLSFEARYNVGLSNVYKDSEGLDDMDITVNNNVLSVSVGYKFM